MGRTARAYRLPLENATQIRERSAERVHRQGWDHMELVGVHNLHHRIKVGFSLRFASMRSSEAFVAKGRRTPETGGEQNIGQSTQVAR